MSMFSHAGNARLGEIIKYLESLPQDAVVAKGWDAADSYRGYYEDLAFSPADNVTVGKMLQVARDALGATFGGYKGGDYLMDERTDCWLAEYGCTGVPIMFHDGPLPYTLPTREELKP